ncbi:MAG: TetR/AcrR family transcriptional regulator [Burkholderiaceae bacterium]|nr:TetR/AcrR family transcriptional regulator [Burkholderiaceae bacterium]
MKTKQAQRRDAIMQIALDMFREVGFEATSMSQIAARVGGSKATLYNYFASKEELLLAAMLDEAKKSADTFEAALNDAGELSTQLLRFVRSLLEILQSEETIKILRVAISVSNTTDVGRQFYELAIVDFWNKVARLLADSVKQGTLRDEDPCQMARHLRGLCQIDLVPTLMGASVHLSAAELDKLAQSNVDVFLRAYGA